ncbi:MAG TPA: rhomboid family intramembrane serine protease, partial [Planctomycetota bacterium]|nr:rhomboid family intramembrane serine protease [Planctomycetota bacterium]
GVGASGAILALLGVFSVGAYARPGRDGPILPRRFWTFILLAVPILFLEGPIVGALFSLLGYEGIGVAVSAHLGGFFGGLLLTLFHVHRVAARETEHEATASRNRLRAHASLGALGALAIAVGVYGLVWPFGNWGWHVFVAKQELERKAPVDSIRDELSTALDLGGKRVALPAIVSVLAQAGELEAAIHYWREVEAPFLIREQIGYVILFGALWKEGRFEDGDKILDELIALADEELARNRSPEILNSAAWFRAERNRDLDRALAYAREAWAMDDGSAIENTLGWVHVLRGEWKEGLDHLENAAKRDPSGPHFLYLALAYLRMQADDNARQYAALARQKGVHLEHERVLLQNLERTLAPPKEPQAPDGVHVIESPRKPF